MIRIKELLKLLKTGYWLDLHISDGTPLSCSVADALKTFEHDKRGDLYISENSISFSDVYYGTSGIHRKTIHIMCNTKENKLNEEIED